jgi:hypothetical protein
MEKEKEKVLWSVVADLTSVDVSLTSGTRSPDETDGDVGSVTLSIFVRFTSNFVNLHPLPPLQEQVMYVPVLTY